MSWRISEDQRQSFEVDGYLIVEGLLSRDEVSLLHQLSVSDDTVQDGALSRRDSSGTTSLLAVRNELIDDVYSAITRSERVANHGDIGRVCHRNDPRRKLPRLLDQALDPATRSDRNNIKAIGMTRNDIKRLLADASSAA